jgi:hypothetical protein
MKAKTKPAAVISFPAATVVGDVEQVVRSSTDARTGIKTETIAREETLAYVKDDQTRIAVLSGASEASKSLCAVCLSIVADVINDTPHIANMAQDAKAWKGAFAKVEEQYFTNGTNQMWQTVKSTVKAWLAKDQQALTGDRVVMTTDGQLNSLRYLKSLTPKAERVALTPAEKIAEILAADDVVADLVLADVLKHEALKLDTMIEAVIYRFGEEGVREYLAHRIKAERVKRSLKIAA